MCSQCVYTMTVLPVYAWPARTGCCSRSHAGIRHRALASSSLTARQMTVSTGCCPARAQCACRSGAACLLPALPADACFQPECPALSCCVHMPNSRELACFLLALCIGIAMPVEGAASGQAKSPCRQHPGRGRHDQVDLTREAAREGRLRRTASRMPP